MEITRIGSSVHAPAVSRRKAIALFSASMTIALAGFTALHLVQAMPGVRYPVGASDDFGSILAAVVYPEVTQPELAEGEPEKASEP